MLSLFCVGACSFRKTGIHPRFREGMLFGIMRYEKSAIERGGLSYFLPK